MKLNEKEKKMKNSLHHSPTHLYDGEDLGHPCFVYRDGQGPAHHRDVLGYDGQNFSFSCPPPPSRSDSTPVT